MKLCTVTFALPEKQWIWQVRLQDSATVGEALLQARAAADGLDIPWDGAVGIFGALCDRDAVPRDGDRIEIYRALRADPKESRRERAKALKAERGQAAGRRATRPGS